MRRITLWALSTVTTLVLLFSYHTSTSSQGGGAPVVAQGPAAAGQFSGSSGSTGSGSAGSAAQTYSGDSAQTRWGPVQVQITVQDGRITDSRAVVYPNGNGRDQEINSYALPVLNREVVQAQGANIDMVSGATVTSDGYVRSLQSAIDQAHP
jgi:uncharacterized protein with FMN-binding domain